MKPEEVVELIEAIDEFLPLFDKVLDQYGNKAEDYMIRFMSSMAKIQGNYRRDLEREGFTNNQAFELLLNTRKEIVRSINERKT